jgi:hypothetical protein
MRIAEVRSWGANHGDLETPGVEMQVMQEGAIRVARPHDQADARAEIAPATEDAADSAPFCSYDGHLREMLFGLRQADDVVAGIAQSHDLAPTRQQDRIIERASPDGNRLQTCDQLSAFRNVLNVQFTFSSTGLGRL